MEQIWEYLKNSLDKVAKETIGVKRVSVGRRKKTPWWNEEVKCAVNQKNRLFRKWMKNRTAEAREIYVQARNQAEEIKRKYMKESWERIGNDLENDLRGTKN